MDRATFKGIAYHVKKKEDVEAVKACVKDVLQSMGREATISSMQITRFVSV